MQKALVFGQMSEFFGHIEQFFKKGANLVVNLGKNDNWFLK